MKKGFTLIELLAVIVILAIIALIAVPIVLQIISDSNNSSKKESINMYAKVIENAVANYYLKHPQKKSVTLKDLEDETLINYDGDRVECDIVQIWSNGSVYMTDCTVGDEKIDYTYGQLQVEKPYLGENSLVPVAYKNNKWVVVNSTDDEWYNYENGKWANAVTLLPGVLKNIGDEVKVDGTEASMMLVWIPRFEYKIEGTYGTHLDGTNGTQEKLGEIKVNFINTSQIKADKNYILHPGFDFGENQLSGIWVGKFEVSYTDLGVTADNETSICNTESVCDTSKLRTLPNQKALRNIRVANFFYSMKGIENNTTFNLTNFDTHMIKNTEWAAVAYLSQSRYGKYGNINYKDENKNIYQNKSNKYITGLSNGTPSQQNYRTPEQCLYDDMTNLGEGKGQCGPGASTTGNIYGVYDMVGGSSEYVMGAYGTDYPLTLNSGFNTEFSSGTIKQKYFDLYTTDNIETACNNQKCLGHALSETNGWLNINNSFVNSGNPWMLRGGYYDFNKTSIFRFAVRTGTLNQYDSSRVVFTSK